MTTAERNHEVLDRVNLLDRKGHIIEQGWARRPMWLYSRKAIKASRLRIKEWDYYAVTSQKGQWALCATISDLGYLALLSISYIDYRSGKFAQVDKMKAFPLGKLKLAPSSTMDSEATFNCEDMRITFIKKGIKRSLMIAAPKLVLPDGRIGIDARLELIQPDDMESMNIATSWAENRKAFYLNEKVNCMATTGVVRRGDDTEEVASDNSTWAVLDWGRGRWTYANTWYWGSGSGFVDGHKVGFNIGYGFTDRSPASENVLFYDNRIHKLNDIEFHIPENVMEDWSFTSSDGRFEMIFHPAVNRASYTNALVIKTDQKQVFGYFTGNAILDDGTVVHLQDFPAFAEKVYNRY